MGAFEQGIVMGRTGPWWLEKGPAGGRLWVRMEAAPQTSLSSKTSSRAILVRRDEVRPLSSEFTPETERQRIQQLVGALGRGRLCSPNSWATRGSLI